MQPDAPRRRLAILAEGEFGEVGSKTAIGVIRYGRDPVVAVVDSTHAGGNVRDWLGDGYDIPVVGDLEGALRRRPSALLIGIAPAGGRLPEPWRPTIAEAIRAGLDVLSGLHVFLGDDPEFAALAVEHGVRIVDHRRPPDRLDVATGREHRPGSHVVLTVGTDAAIGKMSTALELHRAAQRAGLTSVFVPTGQTGMMIDGWGVAIDRVPSDFVQGTVEGLVAEAESRGDWIWVEGQGSLDHPAYSSVTLGLIHGATPHAMVMVHEPGREQHHGWEDREVARLQPLPPLIRLHEQVAGLVRPSVVAAVALNTFQVPESDARREIARSAAETGLPTDDPIRFGGETLLEALRERAP